MSVLTNKAREAQKYKKSFVLCKKKETKFYFRENSGCTGVKLKQLCSSVIRFP